MTDKTKLVDLIGGTRDGQRHPVYWYQRILYLRKKLTEQEADALKINGLISWKEQQ